MALSVEQVRRRLDVDEPDYRLLARELGPDAAPHLRTLVADDDEAVASKAAYLAGLLPDSAGTLALAARSSNPVVRVAAAAGAANLSEQEVVEPLHALLDDPDPGVRKTALRSAGQAQAARLRERIERMARADPDPAMRRRAGAALSEWPRPG